MIALASQEARGSLCYRTQVCGLLLTLGIDFKGYFFVHKLEILYSSYS